MYLGGLLIREGGERKEREGKVKRREREMSLREEFGPPKNFGMAPN